MIDGVKKIAQQVGSERWRWIVLPLMAAVTFLVYAGALQNGFVSFDDADYILENGHVQHGFTWEAVRWAFTSSDACNWHPVTWLSHMLDVSLFWLRPAGHHLTNLLFHVANTLLLATFLLRVTACFWRSVIVALLFALHPLHVESVAWVAERKDVLSTFFFLLTLHAYAAYCRKPGLPRYLSVASLFALGLMSKPMLVTLPAILLILDYWPLGRMTLSPGQGNNGQRKLLQLVAEKLPLMILSLGSSAVTYIVQKHGGAVAQSADTVGLNVGNAIISYAAYLGKMVLPTDLACLYPFDASKVTPLRVAVAMALLLAISASVAACRRTRPYLMTGWLWYLVSLLPVIGVVPIGSHALADRYTYIPLTGIFIGVVWGVAALTAESPWGKRVAVLVTTALLLVLSLITKEQVSFWHDDLSLYHRALAVTKDNWLAHNNLGSAYLMRRDVEQAVNHFEEAIRINPNYHVAYNNLGRLYLSVNEYPRGAETLERAVACNPHFATARLNLGHAYLQLGRPGLAWAQYYALREFKPTVADVLLQSIAAYEARVAGR